MMSNTEDTTITHHDTNNDTPINEPIQGISQRTENTTDRKWDNLIRNEMTPDTERQQRTNSNINNARATYKRQDKTKLPQCGNNCDNTTIKTNSNDNKRKTTTSNGINMSNNNQHETATMNQHSTYLENQDNDHNILTSLYENNPSHITTIATHDIMNNTSNTSSKQQHQTSQSNNPKEPQFNKQFHNMIALLIRKMKHGEQV
jgi:hypothetical protein